MPANGTKNLIHLTPEKARECQKLAVEARKANTARRKALKESLDLILTKSMKRGKLASVEDVQSIAEAEKINISAQEAMAIAMVQRATMGDVQAFLAIRDTIGEKPGEKVEIDQSLSIENYAKTHKVKI